MSAGRLYDKIGDKAKGKIVFVTGVGTVCKIIDDMKFVSRKRRKVQEAHGE